MLERMSDDLIAECRELDAFVSALNDAAWDRPTDFFGWTVRDQILHLHQVDMFGLASMRGADEFAEEKRITRAGQAEGVELSEQARRRFAGVGREAIMATWRTTYETLVECFRLADPRARMTWFGPDMSVVSFASARQMEVWAHGQDIYDLFGVTRAAHERIRNICEIGVRTFGWSFRNRELEVPAAPAVRLTSPGGATWEWPGEAGSVTGPSLDFALVVTQRRAVEDSRLVVDGAIARQWMEIAQCFAGAPQARAEPGSRPPVAVDSETIA
jgi:uncharacterized protein (TIGR03084 family)